MEPPLCAPDPLVPPPAQRSSSWCSCGRGVLRDIQGRLPFYTSDWLDGLNSKGLSSGVYVFFSQAIPATAFAGFLYDSTGGELGVPETLLSMGIGGCLFSILAGQPLVIVGVTGPVTIFLSTLYTLAQQWQIPFRGWLFWVSMWAAAMHIALALCSAPLLFMKSVTAFSGDVFGCLIGVIYIVEGVRVLSGAFTSATTTTAPVGAALLSLLLGLGAWFIASTLSTARSFTFLPTLCRTILADYALPLAVVITSAAQFLPSFQAARAGLHLLPVPDTGITSSSSTTPQPSTPHPWLDGSAIESVALWARMAAALPAAVLTALLFFDHNISSSLSQQPRFNLKKPPAFNFDTLLLGVSLGFTGLLSLPPNYGLIPQAPLHVRSLATIHQSPSGGEEEVWVGVVETRVSPFIQSALLLALLAGPLMRLLGTVPMGVLAGVLIYLGVEGLRGNGVMVGISGIIKRAWGGRGGEGEQQQPTAADPEAATATTAASTTPPTPFLSATCTVVGVQCCAVVGIYFITITVAGIAFPAAILALIPIRLYLLPRLVGALELEALDARDWGAASMEGASRSS